MGSRHYIIYINNLLFGLILLLLLFTLIYQLKYLSAYDSSILALSFAWKNNFFTSSMSSLKFKISLIYTFQSSFFLVFEHKHRLGIIEEQQI